MTMAWRETHQDVPMLTTDDSAEPQVNYELMNEI